MIAIHRHVAGSIIARAAAVPAGYVDVSSNWRVFVLPCKYINVWHKSRTFSRCAYSSNNGTDYCDRHQDTIARNSCLRESPTE